MKIYINHIATTNQFNSNALNSYFVNVGQEVAGSHNYPVNPLSYIKPSVNSMFVPYVIEINILHITQSLKNMSADWDYIPVYIAKASDQY